MRFSICIVLAMILSCSKLETPETPIVQTKEAPPKVVSKAVSKYCEKVQAAFKRYNWGPSHCRRRHWNWVRRSVKGDPLIWRVYGTEKEVEKKESTLILCAVHGDEITPVKFCFDIIAHLDVIAAGQVTNGVTGRPYDFANHLVVVAPIVNPDSFFRRRPTRTNANGVDVNRNFPTRDFARYALKEWRERYRANRRRYPGKRAMSEPETVFQVNLIKRYRPDKIISVHAPLTVLDYDGPSSRVMGGEVGTRANQLLIQMSEKARGYRIKDYPFFIGSLGNYAGKERNIPTYTLELPSSNARNHRRYWRRFKGAINSAIWHSMGKEVDVAYRPN